jgi:hypothetical protein
MTVAAVEFITAHNGTLVAPLSPAPASLVAGGGTVATPGGAASSSHGGGAGSGSNGSAAEGGALPQGPAIRSASISSGSHGSVGLDVAILVLIALVAIAVPFLVSTMRHRRTAAFAGGAGTARPVPPADVMASAVAAPAAADSASLWVPAATRAPEAAAPEEAVASEAPAAPEEAVARDESATPAAPDEPAQPAAAATPPAAPPPAATPATTPADPAPSVEKRRPREPAWLRDHRSQAAMVAAGIGGAVRLLTRGRRR